MTTLTGQLLVSRFCLHAQGPAVEARSNFRRFLRSRRTVKADAATGVLSSGTLGARGAEIPTGASSVAPVEHHARFSKSSSRTQLELGDAPSHAKIVGRAFRLAFALIQRIVHRRERVVVGRDQGGFRRVCGAEPRRRGRFLMTACWMFGGSRTVVPCLAIATQHCC